MARNAMGALASTRFFLAKRPAKDKLHSTCSCFKSFDLPTRLL
jgi:hypothetical protein